MKKIVFFIIFILSILPINNVLANEYNNENTIQKALLIENYIKKHKIRIEDFIKKYNIKDTDYLQINIKELNESIIALERIQNSDIDNEKSKKIIKAIIERIKYINNELKERLNKEKNLFQKKLKKKKSIYSNLGINLSNKIDDINTKIAIKVFKNKDNLSEKETKLKSILIKLNKESKRLRYFGNIDFKSEKEVRESFIRILKNIKRDINLMKTSLK